MIFYITNYLGGLNGTNQSAIDVLIDLLATKYPVTVISNNQCQLPEQVEGKILSTPNWVKPRQKIPFPSKINFYLPIKALKWLKNRYYELLENRNLRLLNPNLVVVNGLGSHNFWQKINLNFQGKTVLIVRESPRHFQKPNLHDLDWALKAMNSYLEIIFVSSQCQKEWSTIGNFKDQKLHYIPNCCREDIVKSLLNQNRSEIRQKLKISESRFVAVCVASLQPRKNQGLLIELLPQLIKIRPNLKLYLIGPMAYSDSWGKSLLEKIEVNGFNEYVEYLGEKTNAMEYIYAADVLLLPSLAEAMPRVILEAMTLKTPVIASDVDGIPELIDHQTTGLLFSLNQPQSFVDAFVKMTTNSEQRKSFGEKSSQKYWSEFSRVHQIDRYKQIINTMMIV